MLCSRLVSSPVGSELRSSQSLTQVLFLEWLESGQHNESRGPLTGAMLGQL
jgi:hypothetical protein